MLPKKVKIVEISPRDGLENEKNIISTDTKINFINQLSNVGLKTIECTSFVSPKWIPQLADHKEVFQEINKADGITYPVVIFNNQGIENAIQVGVKEIAVFTTPSETFCKKNANCTVAESIVRIKELVDIANKNNIRIRAYISCVMGCPFEGEISPESVLQLAKLLIDIGCYEVSLGDTIGIGSAGTTQKLLDMILKEIQVTKLAVHFHNTYGQALTSIFVALQYGISTIDSSVAGLGGCPYAKGATGNVATEDVIYMLDGLSIYTGVDLKKLIQVGKYITEKLNIKTASQVAKVWE